MSVAIPSMPTIGEIARRLDVPQHRIDYLIRARGISPCGRAGNARVFNDEAVDLIRSEIDRIESERERSHRSQA